jgi:outer membrane protein assembly factor BamB
MNPYKRRRGIVRAVLFLASVMGSSLLAHADTLALETYSDEAYAYVNASTPTASAVSADSASAIALFTQGKGWPRYSYDYFNSNDNPTETAISAKTAPRLTRAWQTFDDDALVPGGPPTGFVLESVLGLKFPDSVVGVTSPPVIRDGVIYYIDQLGTMFARDAKTGQILDPAKHWTTTLVDPDYDQAQTKISPDLYYTAVSVTATHVWVQSSFYGKLHAVERFGGKEVDFDKSTRVVDPFAPAPDRQFASNLGDPVVFKLLTPGGFRTLFVGEINVILNDALTQGQESGLVIAVDITDPAHPVEFWRTPTVDTNPATGSPYSAGCSAGSGLALDVKRGVLYGGTGQNTITPYPGYPNAALAPAGYIDRGDSLFAIDAKTGKFKWLNQFHTNDVFDLNHPVPAGPNRTDGPRDADVLAPPVLFSTTATRGKPSRDLVADGSKGGLFRVVDRDTGATVWQKQISKPTGLGGIQAGAAYADGFLYVAGFEGLDDGFSDAKFDAPGSEYLNAFFATFSPAFWADVENVSNDGDPGTGMRVKVYKLDAATGASAWSLPDGTDFVTLAGASLRHVSVANGVVYVTTTAGMLVALDARNGATLFHDQSPDLNAVFGLGLATPQHANMNAGTLISDGMVFVPYGGQNSPAGGIIAYRLGSK